jgi:ABC-type Na+ efflux pump permease subunit
MIEIVGKVIAYLAMAALVAIVALVATGIVRALWRFAFNG